MECIMDDSVMEDAQKRYPVKGCKGYVHVIKEGDTLYKLARQYDVRLFDIMRLNPYVTVSNLQIGDEICIPTIPKQSDKIYVVNEGDTIGQVLQRLDVGFDALARWNPTLLEIELPEGLVLKRPVIQPREQIDKK